MTTNRKRARQPDGTFKPDDPATPIDEAFQPGPQGPDLPLSIDSLAEFMAIQHPDRHRLDSALTLAKAAAQRVIGRPLRDTEPHAIRHGIHLFASSLLLTDSLEAPGAPPLVVRALWKSAC
jgi:hypothetical protein